MIRPSDVANKGGLKTRDRYVDSQSIEEATGPNGGFYGPLTRQDMKDIRTSINNNWPVSDEMRSLLVNKIVAQVERCETEEDREFLLRAAQTMLKMDTTNMALHELIDRLERLDTGRATENQHHKIEFVIVDGRDSANHRIESET